MIAYYIFFCVIVLFTVFDFVKDRSVQLLAYVSLCILLVAFAGLRSLGVDNDGVAYNEAFRLASEHSWLDLATGNYSDKMERGYLLLNKGIYTLGGNIHLVFFFMALLTGLLNYTVIFKYSPMPFLSVLVYACFFYLYRDFTQIRYALSAAFGIGAMFLLVDRRFAGAAALVFFGTFIHGAVLILPVFYIVYVFMKNYIVYLVLPLIGLFLGFLNPITYLFMLGGLPPTLASYVEQDQLGKGGYMLSAVAQIFLLAIFFFRNKLIEFYETRLIDLFLVALSLGSFINLTFISFSIMQRLSSLLFTVIIFIMPYIFNVMEDDGKDRNLALILRFIFILFVLYYGLKMIDMELVRPYSIL